MVGEAELLKVRVASYGAACAMALLALFAASLPAPNRFDPELMADAHAVIVTEALRLVREPEPTPEPSPARVARSRALSVAGEPIEVRLWTYSPRGEIVFDWPEQYQRCVSARARGASEADCPDPNERRRLVLRDGGRPRFDLSGIAFAARE